MPRRFQMGSQLALGGAALLGLGMYGWLGTLSRFLADDYCVAYYAERFGLFRSVWYWYINWSGTFSASIADWLLVFIRPRGIPFVTPIVLLLWLVALTMAIANLVPNETDSHQKIRTALVLAPITLFTILLLSPDVPQSLFWWTGMRAYIIPLIILPVWVIVYRFFERRVRPKPLNILAWSLVSLGMIFFNGGFTETLAPAQLVLFAVLMILAVVVERIKLGDRRLYFLGAALLGALVSLIVVVAAPGNLNRQGFYPPPPSLLSLLSISLGAYRAYLSDILITPQKIAALLGAALAAFWLGTGLQPKLRISAWLPLGAFLAALAFSFGCFVPAAWGLSDSPPARTMIIAAFFLATCLLTVAFTAGNLLAASAGTQMPVPLAVAIPLAAICLLFFAAYLNDASLYAARPAYIEYAQKWERVNAQITLAQQSGSEIVHIPSMDSWTALDAPNDNPKYWLNICYTKFYGIQVLSP